MTPFRPGHGRRRLAALALTLPMVLVLAACSSADPGDDAGNQRTEPTTSASAQRPMLWETGPGSELVPAIPVPRRASASTRRVLYSQKVTLEEGQILLAVAEYQITNDLDKNLFVASMIVLTTAPDSVTGRKITSANGLNVTPEMHHGGQSKNGTYRVGASDAGERYVNLVAWSASTAAVTGDQVVVDQGYGRLSVICW